MILEDKVAEILEAGGFTSPFTDYKGDTQPAPVLRLMFLNELDESVIGERILFIRENGGGGGNRYVQRSTVSIYLVGLQDKSDAATVKNQADCIYTYLLETRENCGIIEVDPTIGASQVMLTDSGRPIVEIQTTVLIDRGIS